MKKPNKKIAIIGGGTMGTVLARVLIKNNLSKNVLVCEKNISHHKSLKKISSHIHTSDNLTNCTDADIIFLAVKPQDFYNIKLKLNKKTLVCSIMAGISIPNIHKQLKTDKVIRAMPNMAARVGEGFTAWIATNKVSAQEKKWAENFFKKMGTQFYVKIEKQIDKATAVTGSGPAYIFYILSAFTEAAKKLGFKEEEARLMVHQVLRGVNALVDTKTDFTQLIQQVASKGGTTEAALKIFTKANFKKTWARAIDAAYKRACELSK